MDYTDDRKQQPFDGEISGEGRVNQFSLFIEQRDSTRIFRSSSREKHTNPRASVTGPAGRARLCEDVLPGAPDEPDSGRIGPLTSAFPAACSGLGTGQPLPQQMLAEFPDICFRNDMNVD